MSFHPYNPSTGEFEGLTDVEDSVQSVDEFIEEEPNTTQSVDEFLGDETSPSSSRTTESSHESSRARRQSHNSGHPSSHEGTLSGFAEGAENFRRGSEKIAAVAELCSKIIRRNERRQDIVKRERRKDNMFLLNEAVQSGLAHEVVDLCKYAYDKFAGR